MSTTDGTAERMFGPSGLSVIGGLLHLVFALTVTSLPASAGEQVRIGIARTMSDVGYYVADAMGYFRDEGIEVTMTPFNSAAEARAAYFARPSST